MWMGSPGIVIVINTISSVAVGRVHRSFDLTVFHRSSSSSFTADVVTVIGRRHFVGRRVVVRPQSLDQRGLLVDGRAFVNDTRWGPSAVLESEGNDVNL